MSISTVTAAPASAPAVDPKNAIRLAAWVYGAHPKLFQLLLAKAKAAQAGKSKTKNISGLGCNCDGKISSIGAYRVAKSRALRGFGDSSTDLSTIDTSSFVSPDLSSLDSSTSDVSSALTDTSGSSGGFWSSLGSGLSSLGSDVVSGIGSVGSYLTSNTGLSSLTGLANTYFANQAVQTQANTQQAVLAAQTQRVASGYSPAPVSYQRNSAGQLVPVYSTPSGYQPLTTAGIAGLASTGMPSWLLPVGLGAAALIAIFAFKS